MSALDSAITAMPSPGLAMNTVPSARACMVTALGLARLRPNAAMLSSVTAPVSVAQTWTSRPLTRRATSPLGRASTGSPPGHGAGAWTENLAVAEPSGKALSRDSGAWARISARSLGCGSRVVQSRRSEPVATAVDSARAGSSDRWNGPVKAPLS